MKLQVVGGSGYLGSEIVHAGVHHGHEVTATYTTHAQEGLVHFSLLDQETWPSLVNDSPDYVVWSASAYEQDLDKFEDLVQELSLVGASVVYVSSDVIDCEYTQKVDSRLGEYARKKTAETKIINRIPEHRTVITGPIYGKNSAGVLDGRTTRLIEVKGQLQEYWDNVIKTYVSVRGLANTIIMSLGQLEEGNTYIGPDSAESYYDFYMRRALEYGLERRCIVRNQLAVDEAEQMGICLDTSYAKQDSRLWLAENEAQENNS